MVFSSHLFVFVFLPLVLALYYALPRPAKHLGLAVASYAFYGWANPAFVLLMLASTVVDYVAALAMVDGRLAPERAAPEGSLAAGDPVSAGVAPGGLVPDGPRSRGQKLALAASVVTNLGLLGVFKYFHFAVDSWNGVAVALGVPEAALGSTLRVVLPLGISFYTFQSMSYTIDVYRGAAAPLRNPIDFACYVSLFPQLVAGPILRFSEVEGQLRRRTHTVEKFARGVALLALGMAKKVLLANPCGGVADTVFDAAGSGALASWVGLLAYSFQIYFDFSGYSDMAIGLGLMLGFTFPKNFDAPYRARSITEFWRRWHISLSTWLRDYLYVPLGGNRNGPWRTYLNLALVMLLGGLWHGAAWSFVAWGALHGALLALERSRGRRALWAALPGPLQTAVTFATVTLLWLPFRADGVGRAVDLLRSLFGLGVAQPIDGLVRALATQPLGLGVLLVGAIVVWGGRQAWDWTRSLTPLRAATCLGLLWLSLAMLSTQSYNPFIYFIF